MCAWPLNFIYVMCATVKHVTDSDKNMFYLPFFFSCSLVPLIVRFIL
jgi:hypothetical protein